MAKLIIANHKLNYSNPTAWKNFPKVKNIETVVCPPELNIKDFKSANYKLGAQNCFWANPKKGEGHYTGEISAALLKAAGVKYIIVGHSERRQYLKETDEQINQKILAVLEVGLTPILCVGEPLEVRRSGFTSAKAFVAEQLKSDLYGIRLAGKKEIVVAYEPVWAIGTGRSDKPDEAGQMAEHIRELLSRKINPLRVIYGGSVSSKNAANFLNDSRIDGALVGGSSLDPKEFLKIIKTIHPHT